MLGVVVRSLNLCGKHFPEYLPGWFIRWNFVSRVQRWTLEYLLYLSCLSYVARPFLQPRPCAKDVHRPHGPWAHIGFQVTELKSAGGEQRLAVPCSPRGNTQGCVEERPAEKCKCVPRQCQGLWRGSSREYPGDGRILALLCPTGFFGFPPCGMRRGCRPKCFSRKRGSTAAPKVSCV